MNTFKPVSVHSEVCVVGFIKDATEGDAVANSAIKKVNRMPLSSLLSHQGAWLPPQHIHVYPLTLSFVGVTIIHSYGKA